MPLDKAGKFHLGSQRAAASDKSASMKPAKSAPTSEMMGGNGDTETGDSDPVRTHLESMHAADGGKHMHVSHDGMSYKTHQVGDDGQVEGPHDHANMEELKSSMGQFFDEEANELDSGY